MRTTAIGATGMVGSRIVAEAADRGHDIVAASRHPNSTPADPVAAIRPGIRSITVDAHIASDLDTALTDADAAVLSVRAAPGQTERFLTLTEAVLTATARAQVPLLVIGGAGPLCSPNDPDSVVLDDPEFVAEEWRDLAAASLAQLEVCRRQPTDHWTYLSPPSVLEPGDRLGDYQRGTTTLLLGRDGRSRISAEDLAVAAVDELTAPGRDRQFTVAAR
ncbi:NAD(P)H-binding protein [Brevibacterium sp. 'Marine']|uniref:NAD(P)-dependent oxidoreductase n=1 Tax=Brevibacterium sp. 'Marine' TaxID=2725563 RepID=UPI00145DE780|nr:NAD(P)H-binding protein [Brevibacterium sp. 'Marine']